MEESEREGQSVYLRAYEDYYHHSLKVTEAAKTWLGPCGLAHDVAAGATTPDGCAGK